MTSLTNQVGSLLVAVVITVAALSFAYGYSDLAELFFREQSTGLMAERLAGDLYVLQQYPTGHIEVDLEDEYDVELIEAGDMVDKGLVEPGVEGDYFLNVTWSDGEEYGYSSFHADIRPTVDVEEDRFICMRETPTGLEILGGKC